ncbi:flagellin A [Campylobacterota bacterium]|nr:flagellin A [Campylobacterota bacterium]
MPAFIINTNIKALNSQVSTDSVNRALTNSLEKLSSGLRINKSADDASGMAIADSLRSQANTLSQAMRNTNDAISMVQVADKAMDEQVKILDTIKTKAAQAAQDTQNFDSRTAIQRDVIRLIEQLDNIAFQTSYNGLKMLAGSFTNKEFQVGAYSNETIRVAIGATSSDKVGSVRKETSATITASGNTRLTFTNNGKDVELETVVISTGAKTGLGVLAETINKNSDILGGIRATALVQTTGSAQIDAGDIGGLVINGITIGDVNGVDVADRGGQLRNAINNLTINTGVTASVDETGRLNLTSADGRGIKVEATGQAATLQLGNISAATGANENYGRLTLTSLGSNDIVVVSNGAAVGDVINAALNGADAVSDSFNLRDVRGTFSVSQIDAGGGFANYALRAKAAAGGDNFGAGVTTREGAMIVMDIAESAIGLLDKIRSDIGSAQQQLEVTLNNISVTQVNVKAAESGIRDVDFGSESSNFSKQNILIQSGSYALSQANAVQQNVLRLLQ